MEGNKSDNHQKILCDFFTEVLGIEQRAAEEGASKMEDGVSMQIRERMAQYACSLKEKATTQQPDRAGSS